MKKSLNTFGLFAGIGGIELGLERAGHHTVGFCEIEPTAQAVLRHHFPKLPIHGDVTRLTELPQNVDLVTAGFPCQDLSQAGRTAGITGTRSGLVGEVFRLLRKRRAPWLLIENVPFMLRLGRGAALDLIISELEHLGYRWAYRVVDTRSFGIPQRRQRVYLLASAEDDPRDVLFADEAGEPEPTIKEEGNVAFGFYWTEGTRGLGWAIDAIPTLKGGSAIGIPSPPAVLLPDGRIVKPSIHDAERLQGFPKDWTKSAETVGRGSLRWKLVGNAVTVDVAEWIGGRLSEPGHFAIGAYSPLRANSPWPNAAFNVDGRRCQIKLSTHPVRRPWQHLVDFLDDNELVPLSERATSGFLSRFEASSLSKPVGFVAALQKHLRRERSRAVSPTKLKRERAG